MRIIYRPKLPRDTGVAIGHILVTVHTVHLSKSLFAARCASGHRVGVGPHRPLASINEKEDSIVRSISCKPEIEFFVKFPKLLPGKAIRIPLLVLLL
jgi:hypothetical protein